MKSSAEDSNNFPNNFHNHRISDTPQHGSNEVTGFLCDTRTGNRGHVGCGFCWFELQEESGGYVEDNTGKCDGKPARCCVIIINALTHLSPPLLAPSHSPQDMMMPAETNTGQMQNILKSLLSFKVAEEWGWPWNLFAAMLGVETGVGEMQQGNVATVTKPLCVVDAHVLIASGSKKELKKKKTVLLGTRDGGFLPVLLMALRHFGRETPMRHRDAWKDILREHGFKSELHTR